MDHPASMQPLSVVVMTYNEEENIGRCLESVSGLGQEICVLDSFSTDRTVEIARTHGARVDKHPFSDFVSQRVRLLQMAAHSWVLMLDADECLSDELKQNIILAMSHPDADGYSCNRRNRIGDTWIRHGSWYPDRKIRLFNKEHFRVEGIGIHESIVPSGSARIHHLKGDLLHYADEDIHARFEKVQLYSSQAAFGLYARGRRTTIWRIGVKPVIRFLWVYILRLGILDGYYGYVIARSEAMYVWLREAKLWELWRRSHPDVK